MNPPGVPEPNPEKIPGDKLNRSRDWQRRVRIASATRRLDPKRPDAKLRQFSREDGE